MTLTDFYRAVLDKMEVTAAGEPAAPEDTQLIARRYVGKHAQLLALGLASWDVADAIPDEAVPPLIPVIAFECADEFGDERGRYADGAIGLTPPSLSERQLRQLHARDYVCSPARPEYF